MAGPKKVLLLDSSPIFRRTLKEVIQIREPQVDISEAETASQARDKLQRQTYDAIFIDIALSNKNGIEFVARVKDENPNSCIVVLTDHDSAEHEKASLASGADYFLSKEYSGGLQLVDVIHTVLGSSLSA
jgi:DNA-binding NarL/FixJ family response regulator